jgi:hypothetical protein
VGRGARRLTSEVEVVLDKVLVDLAEVVVPRQRGEPGLHTFISMAVGDRTASVQLLTIHVKVEVSSDEPWEEES